MTNRKYGLSCGGLIRFSVLMVFLLPVFCFSNVAYGATYTASLSTSGTVTINATSQGNGAVVGTDTLTVNSTCPSGYNITIEGPSDTNLYLNGNSSNNTSGTYIAHSTGTTSSPATITGNNLGTWGYSTTSSTGSGTFIGLTNTATTLTSKNSASASGGDTIPVYYGVSIPSTLTPGTYQMPGTSAITYYLTRSDNCVSYLVSFDANGGTGTAMPDQRIYEGQATALSANTYTPPSDKVFKEWNTAADGSGTSYDDEEVVTDIASAGTTLPLYAIWENDTMPLYDMVAAMSRGTQTAADLKENITTDNSGVFEYDSTVFGASSDANNNNKIYYYRGILDSNLSSVTGNGGYGSMGDGVTWPNYVKLGDTCWRIIRTTGSGGVKMIYNGLFSSGTVTNSCQNATSWARTTSTAFDVTADSNGKSMVGTGYTYNATYKSTETDTAYGTLFGTNTSFSGNSTDSTVKNYLENTWFSSANGISAYEDILEPSAGYCNDRSLYIRDNTATTLISDSDTINTPFTTATSGNTVYYFGAYVRNIVSNQDFPAIPTLECPRNNADLYTMSDATNGNRQMKKPVSLITADEMSFSGSGRTGNDGASRTHVNSFLRTGESFWTLSPSMRHAQGGTYGFFVVSNNASANYINSYYVRASNGIRPVVSLKSGTTPSSGTGTALDPWVIEVPTSSQPNPITCSGANKICYSPNTTNDDVVGTMGEQSANANTSVNLIPSNYSRTGYGFAGWNTEPDYSGTFYGPQENITTPSNMSNGLPLYAVWVKSAGIMQSNAESVCNTLTAATYSNGGDSDESTWSISAGLSSLSALTDIRDGNTYAIAKLTDGKCWTIENLRLDDTPELSSYDTNNPSLPLTNVYDTSSTSNHLSPTSSIAYTAGTAPEGWCTADTPACDNQSRLRADNTSSRATYSATQTMSANANLYAYGNYYNWYSATVGNGTYSYYNGIIPGDACPVGWHMPSGYNNGEVGLLSNSLGGYKNASNVAQNMSTSTTPTSNIMEKRLRHFPNNFLYNGYIYGASVENRGAYGGYWTSYSFNSTGAYGLFFYTSSVTPGMEVNGKYDGRAIRCVITSST